MNNYRTVILTSRNINCSTITAEEFIRAMFSDFLEAEEKYNELYIPEWEATKVRNFFSRMEWTRKRATNFAQKKWKTEKKRTTYIESEVAKARKEYKMSDFYYSLSFFDFDVNPGEMGISGDFEAVKNNKYFKKASGWKLTYKACNNSHQVCFRPHIELIVDAETEAQMKKDADDLTESVRNFYKGCTYWGD